MAPAGDIRAQTDETTPFQMLRARGPAATHGFIKRRKAVASPLTRLLVHPKCRVLRKAMAGGYSYKRVQAGGAAKLRDVPDKNGFFRVAESLQYLLVGGGESRLLVKRPHSAPRAELAVMGQKWVCAGEAFWPRSS